MKGMMRAHVLRSTCRSVKDRALCAPSSRFWASSSPCSSCRGASARSSFRPTASPRVPWRTPSRWETWSSEKITYYGGEPERGDIVTFEDPEIPRGRILIKRVIATGGETRRSGRRSSRRRRQRASSSLHRGQALESDHARVWDGDRLSLHGARRRLALGDGDNRTNSQDSRYFGSIDESTVTGRAVFRYWPLSRIGLLD